jgi:hypothetical protein
MNVRAAISCMLWLYACGDAAPLARQYALQLRAESATGMPLAGARFFCQGHELGPTGADGLATLRIEARAGDALQVSTLCPVGYRAASSRNVRLPQASSTSAGAPTPLSVTQRCDPDRATAALVVRARQAQAPLSLPVFVDGRLVGQTDGSGVAHLLVHGSVGSSLEVRLDSRSSPRLVPRDPVRVFELDAAETLLLYDQAFTQPQPAPTKTRRHAARPAHLRVPRRIE